jgi:gas vesicle protein
MRIAYHNRKEEHVAKLLDDIAQTGADVAQGVSDKVSDLTQNLVPGKQKKAQKNGKLVRKQLDRWQSSLRDTVGSGVSAAQDALQSGIDYTQATLIKNPKQARKRLKKAQKNLKKAQATLQERVGSGLTSTQKVWQQGTKQAQQAASSAREQAQQAAINAREMKENWQRRREKARRRAARARTLFRWGVVVGVVLALLYAPTAGSEVRRRIVEQFQKGRAMLGF